MDASTVIAAFTGPFLGTLTVILVQRRKGKGPRLTRRAKISSLAIAAALIVVGFVALPLGSALVSAIALCAAALIATVVLLSIPQAE